MKEEKKKNQAASVRAKLTNRAKEKGEELQNLLMRFAAERLLYRLSRSKYKDRFLLKGAALFTLWFNEPHRPTKDLDLLGFGENDIPTLENIIKEICPNERFLGYKLFNRRIRFRRRTTAKSNSGNFSKSSNGVSKIFADCFNR